ncbi:MAG: DUF2971 domain-containing protein [Tenuifilaceae bacterium]|nr:DUF2971 domain-containing protein [Tenuifilaceae bacterium]
MKVFKYLIPDRIDVLENMSIRFTQAKYLNDPFESLPFISKLMSDVASSALYSKSINPVIDEIGDRKLSINDIPKEFRNQIPQEIVEYISSISIKQGLGLIPGIHPEILTKKLLSSKAEEVKINYSEKMKESWSNFFGILSLTQSNENITMWSHYAQNHEGFVIEFDPNHEFFNKKRSENDSLGYLREVKYTDKRPSIELVNSLESESELIEYIASHILYTKSIHWSDERELRLIYNLKNSDNKLLPNGQEIYLFSLPPKAIINIFIGVNARSELIEKIESLIKLKEFTHVHIKQGKLDLKEYKIKFK